MPASFINIDRNTPMLLPPDLRDWVSEDDYVHFVIQAIERIGTDEFWVNHRGSGSAQHPPQMMMALLIYCYSRGIFSSRKIERATYENVSVRYLTADTHPDHATICKFRSDNKEAISKAFVEILLLAKELGFLKVGKVSVDGTHMKASASINQNVTYKRAKELKAKLEQDVADLMKEAESSDQEKDHEALPDEIKRREILITKMDEAMEKLKARAEKEQAEAQKAYDAKMEKREEKEKDSGRKISGRKPKPPEQDLEKFADESEKCVNLTDSDSQVMRKNKHSGYTQSYNVQAGVDTDSYLIVGHHVGESPNDKRELSKAYDSIPEEVGKPEVLIADAGYASEAEIQAVEGKTDLYVSVHSEDAHYERQYDYRPTEKIKPARAAPKSQTLLKMKEKLETDAAKAIYRLRSQTVETVFGIIKEAIGFRGFRVRGEANIASEWELVCGSYNLKRLFNMKMA
jgi:transposase